MQADNLVKALGTTTHKTRRNPRARAALTLSALLIAGGTILFGQLGNAPSESSGEPGSSSQAGCSNRTLRGSYALNIDGTIIAGPNRLLLRGVAIRQFDGRGNVSQVDFTTINGAPAGTDWRTGSGTYSSIRTAPERWRSSRAMGARRSISGWSSAITAGRPTTSPKGIRPALRVPRSTRRGTPS